MARTLIGQLILRLRTEGLGEANKVTKAMRDVESAARRLSTAGTGTWGVGFQRQLDKLKLAPNEIRQVEKSWIALHDSMKNRNLAKALRSSEIGHWKTHTVSALAQGRAEIAAQLAGIERAAKTHATRMRDVMKLGLVPLGAYSVPFFGGMLGAEALSASSQRRREIFRYSMANVSDKDRDTLFDRSEELGKKYPSVPITAVMEMARNAYAVMGDGDRGAAVLERMVQSLVALQSVKGVDAAVSQLTGLLRGLDNIGSNADGAKGIEQVNAMIDAATKAAQVDPDFDPGAFFSFARRTKVAGPALSQDFLARASVLMQDMGADVAGSSLAMAFKAFVLEAVGSAGGKSYLAERDRLGIRKNGKLVDSELFGSDPDTWVLKHLVPALERDGVDLNNDTAIAAAVGKLSGNTNATGLLTRLITQREQTERWLKLMENAVGTDVAEKVRLEDPFVGWEAFKTSLENLSAALTPIDQINAGLNGLADGINALAAAGKDNPLMTSLGLGAAGFGAYRGTKFLGSKMFDLFGLKGSALALDGSAAALTRAAVALGGSGVVDGDLPGKKGAGGKGFWSLLATGARTVGSMAGFGLGVAALGDTPGSTVEDQVKYQRQYREFLEKVFGLNEPPPQRAPSGPSFREAENASMLRYRQDKSAIDDLIAEARAAGQEIENSLSVTAKPSVDNSALQQTLGLIRAINSELRGVAAGMSQAKGKVGAEMRRNFADGGGGAW